MCKLVTFEETIIANRALMQIAEKGRNYVCSQLVRYFFPNCIDCGNGVDFLCGDASEMSIGDR